MSLCDPLPLGYFIEGMSLYDTSHPFYFYPIGVGLIMSQSDIPTFLFDRYGTVYVTLSGDGPSPGISLR
jgi:hypothetical protein